MSEPPPSMEDGPASHTRVTQARARADALRRDAAARLEIERERRRSVRAAFTFFERDQRFAGSLLAGGLAFRIFLWLLPLALVLATLLGYFADASSRSPEDVAHDAGMSAAVVASVRSAVGQTSRGRVFLMVSGVVLTLWLGRSLLRALRVVAHLAWGIEAPARASVRGSVALTGFFLILLSTPWLARFLYRGGFLSDLLAGVMMVLVFSILALVGLWRLPRPAEVPRWRVVPGALLLGVGAEALRLFVSLYLAGKLERSTGLYGSLGLAVVLMTWLYLVGRLIVGAANLNATLWEASHLEAAPVPSDDA